MDIIKTLQDKEKEIGIDELCKATGAVKPLMRQYLSGTRPPNFKTCQAVVDLYSNGHAPAPAISEEVLKTIQKRTEMTAEGRIDGEAIDLSFSPGDPVKPSWEGRDVCLCIPSHKDIPGEFFFSVVALAMRYKDSIRLEHRGNDSMIARSRNQLAKRFLKTGATWSIWLDDDMVFPIGHAGIFATMTGMRHVAEKFLGMNTLERLISHKKTFVGGCYWDRLGGGKLIAGGNQPILAPIPSDNLQGVAFVGSGCWAVHRSVFEDIGKKYPDLVNEEAFGNETGFFTPIWDGKRMLGEDESFAKRALEAGHNCWLDLGVICGHVGRVVHGLPTGGSKI